MFCLKKLDLTLDISEPIPFNLNQNNIWLLYGFYDVVQIRSKTSFLYLNLIPTYKFTRMRHMM